MLTAVDKEKRVTIKEAETRTKIPQRTIRKYVKDFPIIPVGRGQHQTLLFDLEAMELLIYTQHLFKERIPKITISSLIEKRINPLQCESSKETIIDPSFDKEKSQVSKIYSEEVNKEVEMLTPIHEMPEIYVQAKLNEDDLIEKLYDRNIEAEKMLSQYVNRVDLNESKLLNQQLMIDCQSSEVDDLKKIISFEKERNLSSVKAIFDLQTRLDKLETPKTLWSKIVSLF
ncbi:MAG: hypothetical protein COB02_01820 [Candidatus Cloacimonadota bacterium]|nr:MAG: hypothetical protein COB02_01820 [Candidatus Cloacimonadota bacterium]